MLVIFDDLEGNRHMPLVGRAHKNRVDIRVFAHGFVIGVKFLFARQFAGKVFHSLCHQIAQRDDLAPRICGKGTAIGLANAHSHNTRTHFFF